VLSVVTVKMLT